MSAACALRRPTPVVRRRTLAGRNADYLDRQIDSTRFASRLRMDIPSIANDQDFGMLMAMFSLWVYALLSPVGGFLGRQIHRRWAVIGSLLSIWSAVRILRAAH